MEEGGPRSDSWLSWDAGGRGGESIALHEQSGLHRDNLSQNQNHRKMENNKHVTVYAHYENMNVVFPIWRRLRSFLLNFFYSYVCMPHMWGSPQRPEEGVGSLRTGVTGDYEPLDMGAGIWNWSPVKAASTLSLRALSPAPTYFLVIHFFKRFFFMYTSTL